MIRPGDDPAAIAAAADALAAGQLLGLPTETVYGLAADAGQDAAVRAIYAAKGRPAEHPLIVHVAGADAAEHYAQQIPDFARSLMTAFWPGPLTLILQRREGVAELAAGGQATVGLRCPSHPVAQAVLAACAERGVQGLAAPSANRFGRISPTTAAHVAAEFGDDLLVLDGGPCEVGIESTIVDCTRGMPVLLRPGQLAQAEIERVAGQPLRSPDALPGSGPRASGTLSAHYAPRARVRLMTADDLQAALTVLGTDARNMAVWARSPLQSTSRELLVRRMPDDAATAAQQLFAVLRDLDATGVKLIWVETPPPDMDWDGVRDRLLRAAAAA